jgi:L-methionine (R)-S-oxide reductase
VWMVRVPRCHCQNILKLLFHPALAHPTRWHHRYIANNTERCLELGPFQGRTAVSRISFDKGVCGTSARLRECVVVADVHAFPGHIACDAASNRCHRAAAARQSALSRPLVSEVVVPVFCGGSHTGALAAVLDIDSPLLNNFSCEIVDCLKNLCREVGASLF